MLELGERGRGESVFTSEGQWQDSRHAGSETRQWLFKSLPIIPGHSFIFVTGLDVHSVKVRELAASGHTKMEKPQVPVLRSLQLCWRNNRSTQTAGVCRRLKVALHEKCLS